MCSLCLVLRVGKSVLVSRFACVLLWASHHCWTFYQQRRSINLLPHNKQNFLSYFGPVHTGCGISHVGIQTSSVDAARRVNLGRGGVCDFQPCGLKMRGFCLHSNTKGFACTMVWLVARALWMRPERRMDGMKFWWRTDFCCYFSLIFGFKKKWDNRNSSWHRNDSNERKHW